MFRKPELVNRSSIKPDAKAISVATVRDVDVCRGLNPDSQRAGFPSRKTAPLTAQPEVATLDELEAAARRRR
ncbi:MAG: hypothetical protein IPH65_15000 [Dehalococcoidia bacterium]|uniref:hypothetical protein n=1 Tax=Candidatus Amarobacter glycogenicus TaxID=3140699 RepID=UPI0031359B33|nr:hypothetical protein [Dehalococcoidia bacterium]